MLPLESILLKFSTRAIPFSVKVFYQSPSEDTIQFFSAPLRNGQAHLPGTGYVAGHWIYGLKEHLDCSQFRYRREVVYERLYPGHRSLC